MPAVQHPTQHSTQHATQPVTTIKHRSALLFGLLLTLILTGCSNVQTTVTRFHQFDSTQPGRLQSGSIQVLAGDAQLQQTLEFAHHQTILEQFLASLGYKVINAAQASDGSDLIAYLSYSIDKGHTERRSESSGMTIGLGVGRGSSSHRSSSVFGSYSVPLHGSSSSNETLYSSSITVEIIERANLSQSDPKRLYEGSARSSSRCASITPIFDEMLTALFDDFPGVSGQTQTKSVKSNGDSC